MHVRLSKGGRWRGGRNDEQRPRGVVSVTSYTTARAGEKVLAGAAGRKPSRDKRRRWEA